MSLHQGLDGEVSQQWCAGTGASLWQIDLRTMEGTSGVSGEGRT